MKILIGQIFSQIVSFLIMLWVMKRYAWKPLLQTLENRKNRIKSELETIEEQKIRVENMIKEYQGKLHEIDVEAKVILSDARKEGQEKARNIQDEAYKQAKLIILKSEEDVQNEIRKAKIQLKNELITMALTASEKFLQTDLDKPEQKQLIAQFVEQVELK